MSALETCCDGATPEPLPVGRAWAFHCPACRTEGPHQPTPAKAKTSWNLTTRRRLVDARQIARRQTPPTRRSA
jgi:hypothetical protein